MSSGRSTRSGNPRGVARAAALATILGGVCLIVALLLTIAAEPIAVAKGPTVASFGEHSGRAADVHRASGPSFGVAQPGSTYFQATERQGSNLCAYANSANSLPRSRSAGCAKPLSSLRDSTGR